MSNESVVKETITQATSLELVNVTKGDFQSLKLAARLFIDRINEISELGISISRITPLKEQLLAFYDMMRYSTQFTREALELQHAFETKLNDFLGRTITLTYVTKEGDLYFYNDAHIGELYAKATRNRGRGNIGRTKMFESYDIEEQLRVKMLQSAAQRKGVYIEALQRWEHNKNEDTMNYDPSYHTFYWHLRSSRYISGWTDPIATRGIIAEGYADAVINEAEDVKTDSLEPSLEALWLNHIVPNSVAAAITGDVALQGDGNILFAVKSGSFSTAQFGQYVRLAYNILQINEMNVEDFKEALPQLIKVNDLTNQIITAANEKSKRDLANEVQSEVQLTININL